MAPLFAVVTVDFAVAVAVAVVVVGCASAQAIKADERTRTLTTENMMKDVDSESFKLMMNFQLLLLVLRESCN